MKTIEIKLIHEQKSDAFNSMFYLFNMNGKNYSVTKNTISGEMQVCSEDGFDITDRAEAFPIIRSVEILSENSCETSADLCGF